MTARAHKTFTVVGATGAVGRTVADDLALQGHNVGRVSRSSGIPIDATDALLSAFTRVDGAFVMIPFDTAPPTLHEREIDMASKLVHALATHAVRRVVLLSGTSAHLRHRAGSGSGAAVMEELLDRMDIAERVYLRACFFMENHLRLGFNAHDQWRRETRGATNTTLTTLERYGIEFVRPMFTSATGSERRPS